MPGCGGKVIPDTRFIMDEFKAPLHPNCIHLLSHFHSDHYAGITKNWNHGVIYCSEVTAELVHLVLEVKREFLHPLELNVDHVSILKETHTCTTDLASPLGKENHGIT